MRSSKKKVSSTLESKVSDEPYEGDISAYDFEKLIDAHCKALGWSFNQLAIESKACGQAVDPTYFGRWRSGSRSATRSVIARLAVTIVSEYARRAADQNLPRPQIEDFLYPRDRRTTMGWETFDWTLTRFLQEAGLSLPRLKLDDPSNVNWEEIYRNKKIRIGWAPCAGWAEQLPPDYKEGGQAIQVTQLIASLLGLTPIFKKYTWASLKTAIEWREIDLTIPIVLNLPERTRYFHFSEKVGPLSFPMKLVIRKDSAWANQKKLRLSNFSGRFGLAYVEGEIGEIARYLVPTNQTPVFDTLEEAVKWVGDTDSSMLRAVASEGTTCDRLESTSNGKLASVEVEEFAGVNFDVCFATHPLEPELIRAVNSALDVAKNRIGDIMKTSVAPS